ncbi:MAG: hypothetical protein QOI76_2524, partial [Frankiales bacterium]|nr:hypothetical protein [Frankiales bacterium]
MSERNEPVDPRHEEALAAALRAQAETVRPAGDGLIRIRARVERRRMRSRLLIPVATTAAVAATVTAVVATGLLAGSGNKPGVALGPTSVPAVATTTSAPTTTPAETQRPSTSTAVSSANVVASSATTTAPPTETSVISPTQPPGPVPIWPFADKTAADAWQAKAAGVSSPWQLDPKGTAERFVGSVMAQLHLPKQQYAGATHLNSADGTATVDVFRLEQSSGKPVALGTVRLSRWSTGAAAPWGVVGVTSAPGSQFPLTIASPAPETTVGAPLPVV